MKKRTLKRTLVLALSFVLLLSFTANHSLVFATVGEDAAAAAVPIDAQTNGTQDMTASTIVTNGEMTDETLATQTTTTTAYPNRHEYTPGLYDGGVYTLRNYVTGEYLSVQNGATSEFSQLTTTTSFFNQYSRFKFDYLGAGLYRFAPLSSPQYYVTLNGTQASAGLKISSSYDTMGEFKIQYAGDGLYRIYAKVTNFETVLCSGITGKATHNNLNDVAEYYWNNTLWELVPYSLTYNAYEKVEFRHETTGRYLNVWGEYTADGSLVYATKYHATENEQFQMHATDTEGEYYFIPTHRTTTYLVATNNLSISTTQNLSTQSFQLLFVELDDNGYPLYQISAMVNGVRKYLNMGTQVPGRELEYYAVFGDDETQFWALETVGFDYHDMRTLEINQTHQKEFWSVDEKAVYTLKNTELDYPIQYRITVTSPWADMMVNVYADENLTIPTYHYVESNTMNEYVLNVVLEPNVNYYCCLYNEDEDIAYYYITVSEAMSIAYHSCDSFHIIANGAKLLTNEMGWRNSHKFDLTTEDALSSNNISDFNSDVFFYTGHGNPGEVTYRHASLYEESLLSPDLPTMSNCKLAFWGACNSATAYEHWLWSDYPSMVQQSISNGADVAIGWTEIINSTALEWFSEKLFYHIKNGASISNAVQLAILEINTDETLVWPPDEYEWPDDEEQGAPTLYEAAKNVVDSYYVMGNHNLVLHPVQNPTNNISSVQTMTTPINYDKAEYTLVAENDMAGIKMYSRLINGISSDDYFLEFYSDGELTYTWKSSALIENTNTQDMMSQSNTFLALSENSNPENFHYRYVDGEWQLFEKSIAVKDGSSCDCQHGISYHNWSASINSNTVMN